MRTQHANPIVHIYIGIADMAFQTLTPVPNGLLAHSEQVANIIDGQLQLGKSDVLQVLVGRFRIVTLYIYQQINIRIVELIEELLPRILIGEGKALQTVHKGFGEVLQILRRQLVKAFGKVYTQMQSFP